jgi:hypothetical protein
MDDDMFMIIMVITVLVFVLICASILVIMFSSKRGVQRDNNGSNIETELVETTEPAKESEEVQPDELKQVDDNAIAVVKDDMKEPETIKESNTNVTNDTNEPTPTPPVAPNASTPIVVAPTVVVPVPAPTSSSQQNTLEPIKHLFIEAHKNKIDVQNLGRDVKNERFTKRIKELQTMDPSYNDKFQYVIDNMNRIHGPDFDEFMLVSELATPSEFALVAEYIKNNTQSEGFTSIPGGFMGNSVYGPHYTHNGKVVRIMYPFHIPHRIL